MNYTGISFPFRIGVRGGVVMSTTSPSNVAHIVEGMTQLVRTSLYSRIMEPRIFSSVDTTVFQPNDESLKTLLAFEVREALSLDQRISVSDVKVEVSNSTIYASVTFRINGISGLYNASLNLGGLFDGED